VKRHRKIAAAPKRNAGEVWRTVTALLADTLERSEVIDRADVGRTMEVADGIGRQLVSGGHLGKNPLVLVAGEMWLEIEIVSGNGAFELTENLGPVPGAAGVFDWTLYLPQVEPLAKLVRKTAKDDEHLSAEEPKALSAPAAKSNGQASTAGAFNEAALTAWAREQR
jgi:hypothetical protein